MIIEAAIGFAAFLGGHIFCQIQMNKNHAIKSIIHAVKKKNMVIFLETPTSYVAREVVKRFQRLGITSEKEFVVLTDGSDKVCSNLGVKVAFGDLYRAVTVPKEVPKFKDMMLEMGFNTEEVAWFLKEIGDKSGKKLDESLKDKEFTLLRRVVTKGAKEGEKDKVEEVEEKKTMLDIYHTMSFLVKDFVLTGINQVTIVKEQEILVAQRELEKMGKGNIMGWVIIIGLLLVVFFIFGPDVIRAFQGAGAAAAPAAPLPNPLGRVVG